MRDDQRLALALCDYIIEDRVPSKSLLPTVRRCLPKPGGFAPNRNIQHMAAACNYVMKQDGAELTLSELVYRTNREGVFRSVFEGQSVGYWSYQSLAFLGIATCDFAPSSLRAEAREQCRWGETLNALGSTPKGIDAIACGRVYATRGNGVFSLESNIRTCAIRGIRWPKVGPKYWTSTSSVSVRPWKLIPELPELLFSLEERAALQAWAMQRQVTDVLAALLSPIRIAQGFHVAAVEGGHVSWMEELRSYAEGKNTAQPLVWARGEVIAKAVIKDPPTGCVWNGSLYVIDGAAVEGYPDPGVPHIKIGANGPVVVTS